MGREDVQTRAVRGRRPSAGAQGRVRAGAVGPDHQGLRRRRRRRRAAAEHPRDGSRVGVVGCRRGADHQGRRPGRHVEHRWPLKSRRRSTDRSDRWGGARCRHRPISYSDRHAGIAQDGSRRWRGPTVEDERTTGDRRRGRCLRRQKRAAAFAEAAGPAGRSGWSRSRRSAIIDAVARLRRSSCCSRRTAGSCRSIIAVVVVAVNFIYLAPGLLPGEVSHPRHPVPARLPDLPDRLHGLHLVDQLRLRAQLHQGRRGQRAAAAVAEPESRTRPPIR